MVTDEEKKEIIREYMQSLAQRSVGVIRAKYGKEHYKKMAKARWDKYRANKK